MQDTYFIALAHSDDLSALVTWDGQATSPVALADPALVVPRNEIPWLRASGGTAAGKAFFPYDDGSIDDGFAGPVLGVYDGTDITRIDLRPDDDIDPEVGFGVAFGDGYFVFSADGGDGRELWVSDGTPAGTRQVADLMPGPAGSNPAELTWDAARERLILVAEVPVQGREILVIELVDLLPPPG